jgi:hypothetical protein
MQSQFSILDRENQLRRQQRMREAERWQLACLAGGESRRRGPALGVFLGAAAGRIERWLSSRPASPVVSSRPTLQES